MNQLHWLTDSLTPERLAALFVAMALAYPVYQALLECFLGYFVVRFGMVLAGIATLAAASALLVLRLHPQSHWALPLTVAVLPGALGGYVFYRYYRAVLSAWAFCAAGGGFVAVVSFEAVPGFARSSLPLGVNVAFGIVVGLGFAVLAYLAARHIIVVASGLAGGFTVAYFALVLLAEERNASSLPWQAYSPAAVVLAALGGAVLSAAGICVQYRLLQRLARPAAGPAPRAARARQPAYGKARRRSSRLPGRLVPA